MNERRGAGSGAACLGGPSQDADNIVHRSAIEADAPALAQFAAGTFVETFAHLYPPEDLAAYLAKSYGEALQRAEIEDPDIGTWLALRGAEIVGYAQAGPMDMKVEHAERDRELYRLYVSAELKGAGVAQKLMTEVLAWSRAHGAGALWLSVWENNVRAQAFYKRYGFVHVGEHKFMVGATADRDFIWKAAL